MGSRFILSSFVLSGQTGTMLDSEDGININPKLPIYIVLSVIVEVCQFYALVTNVR